MNHFADVSSFFKDAHIVLNARNEEDVEPSTLMQHVSKLASRIKIEKSSYESPTKDSKPVGSNYERIIPQNEISKKEREAFWKNQKLEEDERLRQLKEKEAEKLKSTPKCNETVNNVNMPSLKQNQSVLLRKERLQEVESLIPKNNINSARAFFEQNSAASQINNSQREKFTSTHIVESKQTDNHKTYSEVNNKQSEHNKVNSEIKPNDVKQNQNTIANIDKIDEIDEEAEKVFEESNQSIVKVVEDENVNDEFYSNINYTNQFNNYYTESRSLENIQEEQGIFITNNLF